MGGGGVAGALEPWSPGALEPIILKAWSRGAQTIPMAIFSNFERSSHWSPEMHAMEPWSTAMLSLGAQSPLKYALETRSLRTFRGLM